MTRFKSYTQWNSYNLVLFSTYTVSCIMGILITGVSDISYSENIHQITGAKRCGGLFTIAFVFTNQQPIFGLQSLAIHKSTLQIYCKTLNISTPLMLANLAMQYHSQTFMVTKMFIITHVQQYRASIYKFNRC